jgi:hypothetical protein
MKKNTYFQIITIVWESKGGSIIHKTKDKENIARIENIFILELIDYSLFLLLITDYFDC